MKPYIANSYSLFATLPLQHQLPVSLQQVRCGFCFLLCMPFKVYAWTLRICLYDYLRLCLDIQLRRVVSWFAELRMVDVLVPVSKYCRVSKPLRKALLLHSTLNLTRQTHLRCYGRSVSIRRSLVHGSCVWVGSLKLG